MNDTDQSTDQKAKETIEKRQQEQKTEVLEALKVIPIISIAVKKAGIAKSTFYIWIKEDKEFARKVKDARKEGVNLVYDKAFSIFVKFGTDGNNWRASQELLKFLNRLQTGIDEEKPSVDLATILSNPLALSALSEILKIASQNLTDKEKINE